MDFSAPPTTGMPVLVVVILASFSVTIGQSLILLANQVKPRRFIVSIMLSTVIFFFSYLVWVLSIWFVSTFIFNNNQPIFMVARSVGYAYIPLLFAFMGLLPYMGGCITRFLYILTLLAMFTTVHLWMFLSPAQAVLCCGLGALLILIMRVTIGRPVIELSYTLRNRAAGKELVYDFHRLPPLDISPLPSEVNNDVDTTATR